MLAAGKLWYNGVVETNTRRVRRRLEREGWYLERHGSNHDLYRHPHLPGLITLPRHHKLSTGMAATVAKKAIWLD